MRGIDKWGFISMKKQRSITVRPDCSATILYRRKECVIDYEDGVWPYFFNSSGSYHRLTSDEASTLRALLSLRGIKVVF